MNTTLVTTEQALERLTKAAEARVSLPYNPPEDPVSRTAWTKVICEFVDATTAAREVLNTT